MSSPLDLGLRSAVVLGTLVVLLSEALGAVGALTPIGLTAGWLAALAAALVLARRADGWWPLRCELRPTDLSSAESALLVVVVAWLTAILVVALFAPPNTWDAMTYHLPRVEHWLRQASLDFYATANGRQLVYPPGAELLVLQLRALAGGDRLVNLVQWSALAGGSLAAAAVARRLGGSRSQQVFALVFAVTLPMAVAQASGAKNDLVVSFWLLCSAFFLLDDSSSALRDLWAGAALGLSLLTKFTGYIYGAALATCLLAAWLVGRRRRSVDGRDARAFLRRVAVVASVAALLNLGHVGRSLRSLDAIGFRGSGSGESSAPVPGDASGRSEGRGEPPSWRSQPQPRRLRLRVPIRYVNQVWDPQAWISNLTRNLALHAGTPFASVNRWLSAGVLGVHRLISAPVDDPATSYPAGLAYPGVRYSLHEDDVGNGLHLIFASFAVGLALMGRRGPEARALALGVVAAALVFCVVLKWQPWHSRLHLPLFLLAAPLVGRALPGRPSRFWLLAASLPLFVSGLPVLVAGEPRPLLGRDSVLVRPRSSQYFSNRPELEVGYLAAGRRIRARGCDEVGMVLGGNDWEYPLWALLRRPAASPRLRQVEWRDSSPAPPSPRGEPPPCALFAAGELPSRVRVEGVVLERVEAWPSANLYLPLEPLP